MLVPWGLRRPSAILILLPHSARAASLVCKQQVGARPELPGPFLVLEVLSSAQSCRL